MRYVADNESTDQLILSEIYFMQAVRRLLFVEITFRLNDMMKDYKKKLWSYGF